MKFFKTLIASTLGVLIASFILFIIFFVTLTSQTEEPQPYIRNNTVLNIKFSGTLQAKSKDNPFDELFNGDKRGPTLRSLGENLKKAASHDNIKGVWIELDFISSNWANLQEAHKMISEFRSESDKFIYVSTNDLGYNEAAYYLATAADSVFAPPESFFEFDGFYTQVSFYSGLFDKLGIETEITRHGKYKSAVEPYYREDLSEESKYQLSELLTDFNRNFVSAVSQKTGKSADEINTLMNETPSLLISRAYENGLIDSLLYPDQVESLIKDRIGLDPDDKLHKVSNGRYYRVTPQTAGLSTPETSDKIAVIYAEGPILPMPESSNPFDTDPLITAHSIRKQLDDIRKDEDIKAVVLRVNSPGGSGSTSDLIWRMLRETSRDIPVIASMGPVAASGGYYIAMAADTIVAQPTTITGSIGVFSTKFNTRGLFNDKLGITFDEVKTHDHADWLTQNRAFTEEESEAFQRFTDRFYQTFISRVAESRGMTTDEVDAVGQGRVWSGTDAQEQNLVDLIGGMDTALEVAAGKAGIEDYRVVSYPKPKDLFQILMGSAETRVKSWFGESLTANRHAEELLKIVNSRPGDLLLLFPYELNIR